MHYLLLEGHSGPPSLLPVHRDVARPVGHFAIAKSSVIENIAPAPSFYASVCKSVSTSPSSFLLFGGLYGGGKELVVCEVCEVFSGAFFFRAVFFGVFTTSRPCCSITGGVWGCRESRQASYGRWLLLRRGLCIRWSAQVSSQIAKMANTVFTVTKGSMRIKHRVVPVSFLS